MIYALVMFKLCKNCSHLARSFNTYLLMARVLIATLFLLALLNAKNRISRGVLYYGFTIFTILDVTLIGLFVLLSQLLQTSKVLCNEMSKESDFRIDWKNVDNCIAKQNEIILTLAAIWAIVILPFRIWFSCILKDYFNNWRLTTEEMKMDRGNIPIFGRSLSMSASMSRVKP